MCVNYNGSLDADNQVIHSLGGLRPAIWVNIKASDVGNTSDWATAEIAKADELGLIPDSLKGQDLTKPITRAEFAAVAVKVYENLSGVAAIPAVVNPVTDTQDVEVLKAYNTNLMVGTASDKFSPDVLLNREQCATALTRVFKRVTLPGWTLADDANFTLPYTKPAPFADDAKISDWAKDSVYFMAANGIINGTGSNNFSPRATTAAEEAQNYASATREQALIIAVRMVEKLG
jgi:D-alanyl-D-alanine dipeptidase